MGAELLAKAFGIELEIVPADDADPAELLAAAEAIGRAIGDRRPVAVPIATWAALPTRPDVVTCDERSAAVARLVAWGEANGARWDGIAFHTDANGNAFVAATRAISPGELILTLPRQLMMFDNELGSTIDDPRVALAAGVALEARNPTSRWRAYLDALPAQLSELPMFHEDVDPIAGTLAYTLAADDNRDTLAAYGTLSPALRADLSLADFAWGCAIVKSRAYHGPGTLEHRIALLPLVDLLNHRIGDTTWSYDPRDATFAVTTERAFAIGDEVHFAYGDRSNTHLFVHFGFTIPSNPIREAALLFDVAPDPTNAIAASLLWGVPVEEPARIGVACILDHRFMRALSLARLHASGPAERARVIETGLTPHWDMPWLGGALEEAALAVMAAAARRALVALPRHTAQGAWGQACSDVCDAERDVLEQILELTTKALPYLHWRDPVRIRTEASTIPADATGARGLLRQYLHALADALT